MKRTIFFVMVAVLLTSSFGVAQAQRGAAPAYGYLDHKFELHVFGGYAWTFSRSGWVPCSPGDPGCAGGTRAGDIDLKDAAFWGLSLDFILQPGPQVGGLTLLFRTQPTTVTFKPAGGITEDIVDVDVNYYHIGGIGGLMRGKAMPFTMLTLGATHYRFSNDLEDSWRFSMIFGLGAKIYASERLGLKLQADLPFTFFSSGFGVGCGGGGCGATFGGSGLAQIDVGGGLFLAF